MKNHEIIKQKNDNTIHINRKVYDFPLVLTQYEKTIMGFPPLKNVVVIRNKTSLKKLIRILNEEYKNWNL